MVGMHGSGPYLKWNKLAALDLNMSTSEGRRDVFSIIHTGIKNNHRQAVRAVWNPKTVIHVSQDWEDRSQDRERQKNESKLKMSGETEASKPLGCGRYGEDIGWREEGFRFASLCGNNMQEIEMSWARKKMKTPKTENWVF